VVERQKDNACASSVHVFSSGFSLHTAHDKGIVGCGDEARLKHGRALVQCSDRQDGVADGRSADGGRKHIVRAGQGRSFKRKCVMGRGRHCSQTIPCQQQAAAQAQAGPVDVGARANRQGLCRLVKARAPCHTTDVAALYTHTHIHKDTHTGTRACAQTRTSARTR
jgi:hypothetical protein